MKRIALALSLLLASGTCLSQDEPQEFLSWYDGWGTHTIWGAGKVSGSYRAAHVKCGDTLVRVRAIHDSHETDGKPLSTAQTAEHARSKNIVLLRMLESKSEKCIFRQASSSEA